MKLLQVNCVYGDGSTGKITEDIHRMLLDRGDESLVCYGRGQKSQELGVTKICPEWYAKGNHFLSMIRGILYGGCLLSTQRLCRIMEKEKPDVVQLHCLNGYFVNNYRLISWLKKKKIKTVLTLHAEFPYTANCAHAMDCEKWKTGCGKCPRLRQETGSLFFDGTARSFRKMKTAVSGFEQDLTVVSVSPWLYSRAVTAPVLEGIPQRVIQNGIDTAVFRNFLKRNQKKEKVVFHVTAMFSDEVNHPKGGWYLMELAKRMAQEPVRFLVAGKYQIHGSLPSNVILLGEIRDRDALAQLYVNADLTVLTSKRETFSMVLGESLCCGTPVVGFQAGGPESLGLTGVCEFVPFGDLDALESVMKEWLEKPVDREMVAEKAAARLSSEKMLKEYLELYGELIDEAAHKPDAV